MDIRQMRYFERVARLGSFRQASRALYIAQPALSRQVASLERELGGQLFDRSGHRVVLTTTGHRLLTHVDRVLDQVDKLDSDMGYFLGRKRNQIRVTVLSTLAECVLPTVLPEFVRTHSDLEIVIERGNWPDVVEDVAEGRVDAAIANVPTLNRRVREETLFEDELVLVIPAGHDWAGRRAVSVSELANIPLIFTTRGGWFTDIWSPALKQAGVQLYTKYEITGMATIMGLVRAGVAVALVTLSAVDGSLPVARLVDPRVSRKLGWLEPAAPQAQPALDHFKSAVRAHLQELQTLHLDAPPDAPADTS